MNHLEVKCNEVSWFVYARIYVCVCAHMHMPVHVCRQVNTYNGVFIFISLLPYFFETESLPETEPHN